MNRSIQKPKSRSMLPHDSTVAGNAQSKFPLKLYLMLEEAEQQGFDSVVSWLPNSENAFRVHQIKIFTEKILPNYFSQTTYKSFQRQLSYYNFSRITKSEEGRGGYENKLFVRGNPKLCMHMPRGTIKDIHEVARSFVKTRKPTDETPARVDDILPKQSLDSQGETPPFLPGKLFTCMNATASAATCKRVSDSARTLSLGDSRPKLWSEDDKKEVEVLTFTNLVDEFVGMMSDADILSEVDSWGISRAYAIHYIKTGYQMGLSMS